jgi:hypothetical protein
MFICGPQRRPLRWFWGSTSRAVWYQARTARRFLDPDQVLGCIEAGNHLAARLGDFHEPLGIVADPRFCKARQLGPATAMGAQAIQQSSDTAPYAAAEGVTVGVASLRKKLQS